MIRVTALALCFSIIAGAQSKKYEIQQPKGTWQKPGEIRQPTGPWQVPKGIRAIKAQETKCEQRMTIVSDALFEFDKSTLSKDAEQTLAALGPMLKQKAQKHSVIVEGHTDAVGDDSYNQQLSEKRAKAVQEWLIAKNYLTLAASKTAGFGKKRPIAPNTKPDGSDDPEGRQKNRRVDVVVNTCP
jgi:outer membrane protein OmpA-like peptidoglycan-associated protein